MTGQQNESEYHGTGGEGGLGCVIKNSRIFAITAHMPPLARKIAMMISQVPGGKPPAVVAWSMSGASCNCAMSYLFRVSFGF